jgi:transcription elongation factor SPT6
MEQWQQIRKDIVSLTIKRFWLPAFINETRSELLKAAQEVVNEEASKKFNEMLMIEPYVNPNTLKSKLLLNSPESFVIMSVFLGSDQDVPIYLALLDEQGEVKEHQSIPSGIPLQKVESLICDFLVGAQLLPEVIVINTLTNFSLKMQKLVANAQKKAQEKRRGRLDEQWLCWIQPIKKWECVVFNYQDIIAQIYWHSTRSRNDFPNFQPELRMAISFGRFIQNPVSEIVRLWMTTNSIGTFGEELMYLRVHPLQELVNWKQLLQGYEQKLIDVINRVGVDLNFVMERKHSFNQLPFVCGLGTRKAQFMPDDKEN